MASGRLAKAGRGELAVPLSAGYVRRPLGEVALDPDEQVQAVIRLVFRLFQQLGTVHAVLRFLVGHLLNVYLLGRNGSPAVCDQLADRRAHRHGHPGPTPHRPRTNDPQGWGLPKGVRSRRVLAQEPTEETGPVLHPLEPGLHPARSAGRGCAWPGWPAISSSGTRPAQSVCHSACIGGQLGVSTPIIGREGLLRLVKWAEHVPASRSADTPCRLDLRRVTKAFRLCTPHPPFRFGARKN